MTPPYIRRGAPRATAMARNYKREYAQYHGHAIQRKRRALRNAARKRAGLKVGDRREVDHKIPLSKGGTNAPGNTRIVSQRTNRRKANKL